MEKKKIVLNFQDLKKKAKELNIEFKEPKNKITLWKDASIIAHCRMATYGIGVRHFPTDNKSKKMTTTRVTTELQLTKVLKEIVK